MSRIMGREKPRQQGHGAGRLAAALMVAIALFLGLAVAAIAAEPTPPINEHPERAVLNPIGVGLALAFLVLMVNLFRWMFKVPPQLSQVVVRARQSVSALHRILVPLPERVGNERAVELACRLGAAQKAEIILAHVVEVPLTLSLDAPMPVEQARGQEILGTARSIVATHGLAARMQVVPDRHAWSGILRLAQAEAVDAIVMSVGRHSGSERVGHTANQLLRRAECEVILDRAGEQ